MTAVATATMRGLKARGVKFVRDDGFISQEELRRRRNEEERQRRAADDQRAREERQKRWDEAVEKAAAVKREVVTPKEPTKRSVVATVAEEHGVTVEEVLGPSRKPHIVAARQHAMHAIRNAFPQTGLAAIGQFFHRDHTTVLHACRTWPKKAETWAVEKDGHLAILAEKQIRKDEGLAFISRIARAHGKSVETILATGSDKAASAVRFEAMAALKDAGWSLREIADLTGRSSIAVHFAIRQNITGSSGRK